MKHTIFFRDVYKVFSMFVPINQCKAASRRKLFLFLVVSFVKLLTTR